MSQIFLLFKVCVVLQLTLLGIVFLIGPALSVTSAMKAHDYANVAAITDDQ